MKDLVSLYQGFDPIFFRKDCPNEKAVEIYRTFLEENKIPLNTLLLNESEFIDPIIYKNLRKLVDLEIKHLTLIRKHTDFNPLTITIEDLCNESCVKLTDSQKSYIVGRVELHLARLIFPEVYSAPWISYNGINKKLQNDFCSVFGKELIRYFFMTPKKVKRVFLEHSESDKFRKVVGTETHDVFLFWTLAPYIHQDLKQRGILPTRSAEKIVNWVKNAYFRGVSIEDSDDRLEYCRFINPYINFNLGLDERMPSHLLARLYAKQVSKELVK